MPGETVVHGRTARKQAGVCTRAREDRPAAPSCAGACAQKSFLRGTSRLSAWPGGSETQLGGTGRTGQDGQGLWEQPHHKGGNQSGPPGPPLPAARPQMPHPGAPRRDCGWWELLPGAPRPSSCNELLACVWGPGGSGGGRQRQRSRRCTESEGTSRSTQPEQEQRLGQLLGSLGVSRSIQAALTFRTGKGNIDKRR